MIRKILQGAALVAFASFGLAVRAQDTNIDQSQFPVILQQPVDQCLPVGSSVTFSVVASNVDSYQWYKNNAAIDGETNSTITIASLTINDVAYYGAAVINSSGSVPTRMANLNVYTVSTSVGSPITTLRTRLSSSQTLSTMMSPLDSGGVITVFGSPVCSAGSSGSCPGSFSGYVVYAKTPSQGWGWAPTANAPVLSATDTNRVDTKLQAFGKYGDLFCDQSTVSVATPPASPKYRFTVFFPPGAQIPTNAYPLTLTGFDP